MDNKEQIEYVIGIDFGHGETSAAYCSMEWDKPVGQLCQFKDIELGPHKKMPSAILISKDRKKIAIGDAAFNEEAMADSAVFVGFKKAPKDINGEKEQTMILFMKAVYLEIRKKLTGTLTDQNHLVYIAMPSGWDEKTSKLYWQMAQKAGLPIPENGVTKESRAALIHAQQDPMSTIGKFINDGVIVFDLGSSTLDFSYTKGLQSINDNGYNCGASRIEDLMLKDIEEDDDNIKAFDERYPEFKDAVRYKCRTVKEDIYEKKKKITQVIQLSDFLISDEDIEDSLISYRPQELNDMLEKSGYIKELEDAMLDFKKRFIPDQPINCVFLTGGASRMDFVRSLITRCWNVADEQIQSDSDPSLSISQGVAEVARMDLRTADVAWEDEINSIKEDKEIFNKIASELGKKFGITVSDSMIDVFDDFIKSKKDLSLNDLNKMIKEKMEAVMNHGIKDASQVADKIIKESIPSIHTKIETLVSHYSKQPIKLAPVCIGTISISQLPVIDMSEILNHIADLLAEDNKESILLFFSDTPTRSQMKSKKLGKKERNGVYNQIAEQWDGQNGFVARIDKTVKKTLMTDSNLQYSIDMAVEQLIENYKREIQKIKGITEWNIHKQTV